MSNANIDSVQRIYEAFGTGDGKSATMNLHHWWSFRDGNVVLSRGSEDTALVAERLGS